MRAQYYTTGNSEIFYLRHHSTVVDDSNTDVQSLIYLLNRTNDDREPRNATGEG